MTRAKAKIILTLFGTLAMVLIFGCASHKAAGVASQNSKRILDITIHENSGTLILTIIGSQALTYSSERQPNPPAILLYFPATTIDHVMGRFVPPENDIVSTIRAGSCSIFIASKVRTLTNKKSPFSPHG